MVELKTSESRDWNICHFWSFLDKEFKFQLHVFTGCNDVLMMSINLSNIAILNIQGADYRCVISGISKSETINLKKYRFD